ncbi:hypothetical protein [Consotaella salsifontis]|uniref:Uncharacterized protein n=1 Tax=Consotaella salsifontis TaxID=1365950 RepID=A0A1T4RMA6_9HYPH|nr:hypothetical protein [Consotaella salsifontis]SKA17102.1 hypothetical protein SAMN05428963_10791 [Consotaella salsifontis]
MAVRLLEKSAPSAPVSVFAAVGAGSRGRVERLFYDPRLTRVLSVRQANVLLVAGSLRDEDHDDLRRLHDQMPPPRATVWWGSDPIFGFDDLTTIAVEDDPVAAIVAAHRALIMVERASEPDLLPNEPANPWRGEGPHGQGGKGMMGGTPYGRPMAMTNDDLRDGLALDAYTAPFGPFLPMLPPGLKLSLTLQGDVVQKAEVLRPPLAQHDDGPTRALRLRRVARLLRILGLDAHADRLQDASRASECGEEVDFAKLRRLVRWSGALAAIPPGLGVVDGRDVRSRMRRWLDELGVQRPDPADPASSEQPARLVDLLEGLEWTEAILVINSFDDKALLAMAPVEKEDGNAEKGEGEHHHHDHSSRDHHSAGHAMNHGGGGSA